MANRAGPKWEAEELSPFLRRVVAGRSTHHATHDFEPDIRRAESHINTIRKYDDSNITIEKVRMGLLKPGDTTIGDITGIPEVVADLDLCIIMFVRHSLTHGWYPLASLPEFYDIKVLEEVRKMELRGEEPPRVYNRSNRRPQQNSVSSDDVATWFPGYPRANEVGGNDDRLHGNPYARSHLGNCGQDYNTNWQPHGPMSPGLSAPYGQFGHQSQPPSGLSNPPLTMKVDGARDLPYKYEVIPDPHTYTLNYMETYIAQGVRAVTGAAGPSLGSLGPAAFTSQSPSVPFQAMAQQEQTLTQKLSPFNIRQSEAIHSDSPQSTAIPYRNVSDTGATHNSAPPFPEASNGFFSPFGTPRRSPFDPGLNNPYFGVARPSINLHANIPSSLAPGVSEFNGSGPVRASSRSPLLDVHESKASSISFGKSLRPDAPVFVSRNGPRPPVSPPLRSPLRPDAPVFVPRFANTDNH